MCRYILCVCMCDFIEIFPIEALSHHTTFQLNEFFIQKKEKKFKRKMKNEKTQEKCLKSRVEEEGSVRRSLGSK